MRRPAPVTNLHKLLDAPDPTTVTVNSRHNQLPPIQNLRISQEMSASRRKEPNWSEFYKNGIPKEVIIIDDSPPMANSLRTADGDAGEEITLNLNDTSYYLIPHTENFLAFLSDQPSLVLVLLVSSGHVVTRSELQKLRSTVLDRDDVYQNDFAAHIVFLGAAESEVQIEKDARAELHSWGTKAWSFVEGNADTTTPPGPYVATRGQTWQPWRVYRDFNGTFMATFKPSMQDCEQLETLDAAEGGLDRRVIVPSRCYFSPSKSRPLAGARISVKDNINVAGHKTTLCNRSWARLYPPASRHAACVQKLLDAGAIIVGKTKLQAMIMREEPLEAVEFTAPFNPRADGYQVPSGSSHGSGAAIGSYDWLDYTLGSDTNGSGRKPAQYNGAFSIRPSTGILDTEGVIGQFSKFDMPVFYSRDLSTFPNFISTWYGDSPALRKLNEYTGIRILWPTDYLPTPNDAQSDLIDRYAQGLEKAFGVQRTMMSIAGAWRRDLPDGKDNGDLAEYLKLTGSYPYYYDSYWNLEQFRTEYKEKYGTPPFIHRAMKWQWDVSKKITEEERDFYWARSELYREWLLKRIFRADDKETVTIMVFPIEAGKPSYRDAALPPYYILSGYASLCMSPILRGPEVTTLIGDIPYHSVVTEREEPLPIAASIIGAPGTDLILADVVRKGMDAGGFPTTLKTGRSMH